MKNMLKKGFNATLMILILIAFIACEESDDSTDNNKSNLIQTGDFKVLSESSLGSSGGDIVVSDAESSLDGMTVSAPDGALSSTKEFEVSSAEIEGHSLGERFNPVTPLIRIKNGGEYADGPIFIDIPIEISEDEIPAAFFFDDVKGNLEVIPVLKYTTENVIIATRHFATSGMYGNQSSGKIRIFNDDLYANIVISSVKKSDLEKAGVLNSGFEPGKDDWEFPNYGSYIEKGGNCSGHSISSLWYYVMKKPSTDKQLNGQFDRTGGNIWQDNPLGIRMVTKTQNEQGSYWHKIWDDFNSEIAGTYDYGSDFYKEYHKVAWNAAAAQMYVSGKPMYTIVSQDAGDSHAVIAYKIDYSGGKIYLADPNFPGNKSRMIQKTGDNLQPYQSGDNANDPDAVNYTEFAFFGMSAMYNWSKMEIRWAALENKTIGNDLFPTLEYTLSGPEGESELGESIPFDTENDYAIACRVTPRTGAPFDGGVIVYNGETNIAQNDDSKWANLSMTNEENNKTLGIWVWQMNDGVKEWIDFRWVSVSELRIEPDVLNGEKDQEYEWEAVIANPPANARYEWNFGDGSATEIVKNNKKVSHTYKENGVFPVILELYDDASGQFAGVATAYANIGAGFIDSTYQEELYWLYPVDEDPTLVVDVNGVVNAPELEFMNVYRSTGGVPTMYIYKAKSGGEFNIELNIDHSFKTKKMSYETGQYYGVFKYDWEFETVHDNLTSFINDGSDNLTNINITKNDSTGKRYVLRGTVPKDKDVNLMLIIYAKYKYLEKEYYREDDGTETTNTYDEDGQWHTVAISIQFKK